ncbi:MAG: V4R domain-containing protein [Acidithiobacillus ferriphilus]|jgi:hypothetical protein|uniref:4-vinyl reductase 4VR domain-containing protein n=2 Tax=Acidithiobacillus TaxID=119977 RepID=A0A179B6X6_ACIFR|nr:MULTISPECIES: V4R domain-containing protein [Acidithiobacillus]MDA8181225.1 hypothetical protein [Acidithiobacillus sp.]MBU2831069.1 hypothetical protein [Acidithiobacillus ferriphilus]MBU2833176.1 hypothetical protein [Acidithiobacillus ferriphilus]MBU2854386.1 hypothetical protein [Acidithiobacillus ferriphilus]MBW9248788.1 hypothetical protein [Acidithiobacillus ferriphilus]
MAIETNIFEKIDFANATKVVRPTLGNEAPIALFRLVRLILLEDMFGVSSTAQAYLSGRHLGYSLGLKDLSQFVELCEQLKIGVVKTGENDKGQLHIDVYECVTCSGMEPVGRTLCSFEGGLIAGVAEGIFKNKVNVREVTCIGGLGHESCGFDIIQR